MTGVQTCALPICFPVTIGAFAKSWTLILETCGLWFLSDSSALFVHLLDVETHNLWAKWTVFIVSTSLNVLLEVAKKVSTDFLSMVVSSA